MGRLRFQNKRMVSFPDSWIDMLHPILTNCLLRTKYIEKALLLPENVRGLWPGSCIAVYVQWVNDRNTDTFFVTCKTNCQIPVLHNQHHAFGSNAWWLMMSCLPLQTVLSTPSSSLRFVFCPITHSNPCWKKCVTLGSWLTFWWRLSDQLGVTWPCRVSAG